MSNTAIIALVICVISINISSSIFMFILLRRTSRRLSRALHSQHGLMSTNRSMIKNNRDCIDATKDAAAQNRTSIDAHSTKISANEERSNDNREKIAELSTRMEEFKMTIRSSMYIREANAEKSNGLWCFEYKGERKYYKPGRIEKVEHGDEVTTFDYEEDCVIAHVRKNKTPIAEIVYSLHGAPISGRIYEKGKLVRSFEYDKLGQVV